GIRQRFERPGPHRALKRVLRLEQSRRIDEHELRVFRREDTRHTLARRLRARRDDAQLLAQERVEQRRLSDVRSADEGDVPGARYGFHRAECRGPCGSRSMRGTIRTGAIVDQRQKQRSAGDWKWLPERNLTDLT